MAEGNNNWKSFSANYASTSSEIKSHSSVLFNERVNALWMMYDTEAIDLMIKPDIKKILRTRSLLTTIWRNVRPLISNNPKAREVLKLDTKHPGIYSIDMGFGHIQECITEMITTGDYMYTKLVYTVQQIQNVETIMREVLQFFSYFMRTDFKQKPDISVASEKYKGMADERTVNEFKALLGHKSNAIADEITEKSVGEDFFEDDLGSFLESDDSLDSEDKQFKES